MTLTGDKGRSRRVKNQVRRSGGRGSQGGYIDGHSICMAGKVLDTTAQRIFSFLTLPSCSMSAHMHTRGPSVLHDIKQT